MKFLKYLSLVAVALLAFSCQEVDHLQAKPAEDVEAPVLNPHSDITIDSTNLENEVTFSWSAVDYGYHAAVTYSLYVVYGENKVLLGESYSTTYTITKEAFNNTLVNERGLALPAKATSTITLYLTSSISANNPEYIKTSNQITMKVTTIEATTAPWFRRPLFIAGNFQGWAPDAQGPVLWETEQNSDIYEGLVYLGTGKGTSNDLADNQCHFKFCPNPNWTGNLGGDPNKMTTEGDPAHILADEGIYWISVTLNEDHTSGSVKMTKVGNISVIGDAVGGWGDSNDLVLSLAGMPAEGAADFDTAYYAAMRAQVWEGVIDNCAGGEFKYRLTGGDITDPWAMSWGGSLAHLIYNSQDNLSTDLTGKVRFAIDFHGDIAALGADASNPSPVSGVVEQAE